MKTKLLLTAAFSSGLLACSPSSPAVVDIAPGPAPVTARFGDYGEMSGMAFLNLTELPDPDSEIIELAFQPESSADGGMHFCVNPIGIPPNQLEILVSGASVELSDTAAPVAYGALPVSGSPDYSDLIHRRPTSIRLAQRDGARVTLLVALGPLLDVRGEPTADASTSELRIDGTLSVSCRVADGREDPTFESPFCASLLSSASGLAEIAGLEARPR